MNRSISMLICVFGLGSVGCSTKLQQGLDERSANEILSSLVERGFEVRKMAEGGRKASWAIEVDKAQLSDATRVLVELGLPRQHQPSSSELLKPGLVPSPSEELQAKVLGLQGDLARTLESVDGVLVARVHLAVPAPPRPGQPPQLAKAAAFLRVHSGHAEAVKQQVEGLRQMIAGSVEGLTAQEVTLVVSEAMPSVLVPSEKKPVEFRLRVAVASLGVLFALMAIFLWVLSRRLGGGFAAPAPAPVAVRPSGGVFRRGVA